MKYLQISSLIALSAISFSFRPMEGVYNHNGEKNYPAVVPDLKIFPDISKWLHDEECNNTESVVVSAIRRDETHKALTYFIHDHQSSLRIEYSFKNINSGAVPHKYGLPISDYIDENKIIENLTPPICFFNCDFTYDQSFWDQISYRWGLRKKRTSLFSSNPDHITPYLFSVIKQKSPLAETEKKYEATFYLNPQFTSKSGVKINNTGEQIILKLGTEKIPLKIALQQYLKELPEKNLQLLNSSEILAVWCLVPNQIGGKEAESQLIGLAKNSAGQLFHWITDLENDISALIPRKEKESSLSRLNKYIKNYF